MKTQLVITDVTRMHEGRVCIAGYNRQREGVRPTLPHPGIHESSLYSKGKPLVFPFAVVEYELLEHISEPPHTEDWRYDPKSVRLVKQLGEKDKQAILDRLCCESVDAIFGAKIFSGQGYYLLRGQGKRSLGTIRPAEVSEVIYEQTDNAWKYRMRFIDDKADSYRLTVTDLTWRYYCDSQRQAGKSPRKIASELIARLRSSQVYLRIGLARGWDEHPDRCYLQITGIFTFPDYLGGQTFADFAPRQSPASP
ncbi:MAG: hypothetical protein KGJ80_10930 [Chloroflexota bacterium]|nr:hypothetical protein [Chloroflexota bacterium]